MNPYAAYKRQSITTMTPIEIVVKLYDECERQLNRSIPFIEEKQYGNAHTALARASEMVDALREVLNMEAGGEISKNLDSLYAYFYRQITYADTKKDVKTVQELIPQIGELKDAFVQLSKLPREATAAV